MAKPTTAATGIRYTVRQSMYNLALDHLENRVPTTMEDQNEARLLLQYLVEGDCRKENAHDLIRAAHAIMRGQYVSPATPE